MMPQKQLMDVFEELFRKRSKLDPLLSLQAWSKWKQLGLPQKEQEAFQYLPLRKMYDAIFQSSFARNEPLQEIEVLPECRESCFVFVDGVFREDLSCRTAIAKQVIALPLQEAFKSSYGQFLKMRVQQRIKEEEDSLTLLNLALCTQGLFLYIPPKTKLSAPIQLLHIQQSSNASYIDLRVHICLGQGAEVEVIESSMGQGSSATLHNRLLDVALEEKALFSKVSYQEEELHCWSFSSFRASLKKEASLRFFCATEGSLLVRQDCQVALVGERAEAELLGLAVLSEQKQAHVHARIDHIAPCCRSLQLFKHLLLGEGSCSSFTGHIHVKKEAQKTEAYQLNQNLLLSSSALASAKPNLQIYADDVKASHGATISQLEEEPLFYLKTRGLSTEQAQKLILKGFIQDMVDKVRLSSVKKKLITQGR